MSSEMNEVYIISSQNESKFSKQLLAYKHPTAKFIDEAEQTNRTPSQFIV